jgi:hypothetical protein
MIELEASVYRYLEKDHALLLLQTEIYKVLFCGRFQSSNIGLLNSG